MPKLPTALDLGPAPASPSRPVGTYDVSGFARGAQALAGGAEALGKGVSNVGADVAEVQQKWNESKAFDAHAGASSELLNLHSALQKSKDYADLNVKYEDGARKIVDGWAKTIPDGRLRQHFLASQGEAVARGAASVSDMAFNGLAQTDADARKASLMDIEAKIGEDPTNAFLPDAMKGLALRIDKAVAAGWETQERGDLEKRQAAVQIAIRTNEFEYNRDPEGWLRAHGYEPRQSKAALRAAITKAATENGISPEGAARVIQIESGGDPNARTGSYHGLTQISQSEFAKYNKTPGANIYDPEANMAAGFAKMRAEGDQFAGATGKQPTDFERYMIHQQGLAGYQAHVSNPDAPAWQNMLATGEGKQKGERWAKAAIWGNIPDGYKHQIGNVDNVTSADFLKMWADKYGGTAADFREPSSAAREDTSGFRNIDQLTQMRMVTQARSLAQKRAVDAVAVHNLAVNDRAQQYGLAIEDAGNGRGAMPPLALLRDDPLIKGTPHELALTRQWDAANKQDEAFQSAWARFRDPNAGPFNQVNDDDKKQVDKIYQVLASGDPGNEISALQSVVDRTGIVPASAASSMRGALVSNRAPDVLASAQMARNLLAKNPQIFTGVAGGKDIEDAAISYGQYTEHFGMTPEQAARKIIEDNSPEYKAQVAARIKNEDVGEIVKKQLTITDLEKGFASGWSLSHPFSLGRPTIEFNEGAKAAAFQDYAELFKSKYLESGNVDTAKAKAIAQMQKVWGVTRFNGAGTGNLMRFAPENAPAYAGIPDVSDRIADAAIAAIKSEIAPAGPQLEPGAPEERITRDKIMLTPTPGGQTAAAYFAGQPVPYLLSWLDKDGAPHFLNPGKAFVFDAAAEREKISEERRLGLEKGAARLDADERALGGVGTRSPAERLQAGPERRSDIMSDETPDAIIPGAQYAANLTPLKGSTESVRPGKISGEGGGGGARIDFKSSGAQRGESAGASSTKSLSDLTADEVAARDANSSAYQARLKERLEAIAKTKQGREAIAEHAKKIEDSDRINFKSSGAGKRP